jgi:putative membrane protein insertion efficiency factor
MSYFFTYLILTLIKIYKFLLSPLLGMNCRFEPTCSAYCEEAIKRHGIRRGLTFFLKRFSKCHPWGDSGFDPVPEEEEFI